MTVYRLIPPKWLPGLPILEGRYTDIQIKKYNQQGYNVYFLPNYPSQYESGVIDGTMIDTFDYVFVDMDVKDGIYTKDSFLEKVAEIAITPTQVVDSGNGIHVYWKLTNLDGMSYLRFQRRLIRLFNTDDSLATLYQLMRKPGTLNTKIKDAPVECVSLYEDSVSYTSEQFDKLLPAISKEDEAYCLDHYNRTFNIDQDQTEIKEELPAKFGKLVRDNAEASELFANQSEDRSKNDFRLGHLLLANGFTREEALSVLINSAKASQRAPIHRRNYALNIVNKIWTFEADENDLDLSDSVADILMQTEKLEGERFPCYRWIDNTECGFRLGHVLGLVAGSGVGKTTLALNMFKGFVAANPNYDHFFIPLEQPAQEIAKRWKNMCGEDTTLHKKVHIISNYDKKGTFRDLSLADIKNYILKYKKKTGRQVGCVVIDHIGVLCNTNRLGQDEGVKQIAKDMKSLAIETNTFVIMQSQTSREKAGVGDLELNKDAAFGTSVFENFCDYLVTLWQPVKQMYSKGAPTVMAFKFCKIRHKNQLKDVIKEDVPYTMYFNPETELVRQITQDEEKSFTFFLQQAINKRKADRKTEIIPYKSARWDGKDTDVTIDSDRPTTKH